MRCQFVFNPWEARAFIAKTILNHPDVEEALENGVIALGRGITNAYILREMLEVTNNTDFQVNVDNYVAGIVDGTLWASNSTTRTPEVAFYNGEPRFEPMDKTIEKADLVIKGGNALGPDWIAGVLCAHPAGGTIGIVYARAVARGIKILVPISVGKMIPYSVTDIVSDLGGQRAIDYVRGMPVGLFPIVGGEIFSEIEAIQTLGMVEVYPIGAGGVYGGAGATIFELSGIKEEVKKIIDLYEKIKNTKPLNVDLQPH
ncbi:MAG: hypothetical protein ACFFC6_03650 [Promethearchaeota archaeon]